MFQPTRGVGGFDSGAGSGAGGGTGSGGDGGGARVFSVTHRVPGPMGFQMLPLTLTYQADSPSRPPIVTFACLITGSTKIPQVQPGDVLVSLNGGPPLLSDVSGDGHVINVATMLSKTRPAVLKIFRCPSINPGTTDATLTAEERTIFFNTV